MKKFRNVPALITLLAGFVTSVLMIINRIPIVTFLWTLALVMVGFFFVGLLVRFILNKFFQEKDDENKYNNDNPEEGEENADNMDGAEETSGEETSDSEGVQ
ncbi:MAG: hypothetical protein SPM04_08080 [Lachnospira sp.]|nr:hypothetical protein [Lachnospira sp.]